MEDFFKVCVCAALAAVCWTAPQWVPVWAEAAAAEEVADPEQVWFSGATPDCPVWEVENSLPPTVEMEVGL